MDTAVAAETRLDVRNTDTRGGGTLNTATLAFGLTVTVTYTPSFD